MLDNELVRNVTCGSHVQTKGARDLLFCMNTHLGKVKIQAKNFDHYFLLKARNSRSKKNIKADFDALICFYLNWYHIYLPRSATSSMCFCTGFNAKLVKLFRHAMKRSFYKDNGPSPSMEVNGITQIKHIRVVWWESYQHS